MPVLTDPVDPGVARGLRRAVLSYQQRSDRATTSLQLGEPSGAHVTYAVRRDQPLDAALRVEIVAALAERLEAARVPLDACLVWLARPGSAAWHDADAHWLPAAVAAFAEVGRDLTFVVVTTGAWVDPRSGTGVTWKRLRDRRRKPGSAGSAT